MEISNLSDAEFKTLVIRMLKDLSEDLSSIKKTQSETKDTLIEIQNNLQGNNRTIYRVEWMKLRIKSMIWNIRKPKSTRRKKNSEERGWYKEPLGQLQ